MYLLLPPPKGHLSNLASFLAYRVALLEGQLYENGWIFLCIECLWITLVWCMNSVHTVMSHLYICNTSCCKTPDAFSNSHCSIIWYIIHVLYFAAGTGKCLYTVTVEYIDTVTLEAHCCLCYSLRIQCTCRCSIISASDMFLKTFC